MPRAHNWESKIKPLRVPELRTISESTTRAEERTDYYYSRKLKNLVECHCITAKLLEILGGQDHLISSVLKETWFLSSIVIFLFFDSFLGNH